MKKEMRYIVLTMLFGIMSSVIGEDQKLLPEIKNILLIMSDDLKASSLSVYGNEVCKTPNIDRLAASGVVFEKAYCQGMACWPSRPSMMSSIYPFSKAKALTIGEHLQKFDMHTARVGKIFHMGVPHAYQTSVGAPLSLVLSP